jgi:speckle-type POZ protein
MFEDESLADFELECNDGKTLKCHKFILAARSPVFRTMLSVDMKESREGFVIVPDLSSIVMKEVLRFMYCSTVENLDEVAKDLIFAAEKYELNKLKEICFDKINEGLSKANVIQTLHIANKISESEELFEKCARLIAR